MAEALRSAIQTVEWGADQKEQSASLTPDECRAVLQAMDDLAESLAEALGKGIAG